MHQESKVMMGMSPTKIGGDDGALTGVDGGV